MLDLRYLENLSLYPIVEDQQINPLLKPRNSKWIMPSNLNKLNNFIEVSIDYTKINQRGILSPQPVHKNRFNICKNNETPLFIKKLTKRKE